MRIWLLILFLILPFFSSFSDNYIEIDLNKREINLVGLYLGDIPVNGTLSFESKKEDDSLIFITEGKDIFVGARKLDWIKAKFTQTGNELRINYLRLPDITARGKMDLISQQLSLNIQGSLDSSLMPFGGERIRGKVDVWGRPDHIFTSGLVTLENGEYEGMLFSSAEFSFIGSPPILSITDSKITLLDGSIFKADGIIDLNNLNDVLPRSEFTTKKFYLDEWDTIPEGEGGIGLRKDIDEKMDVTFSTKEDEYDDTLIDAGAEVRYKVQGNKFLKLRVEEDQTIIGFERRTEF